MVSSLATLMDLLSALNPAQRDAVEHTEGPLLILAGAGSGKTRVITIRIAHLIGNGLARPDEVLAVTFTNKAAEEMRDRVEQLLGEDCRQVWLSTFHSLCARLLRREAPSIGLSRDFVIYDSSDQLSVVKQAMQVARRRRQAACQPRAALSRISQAKNKMESPEAMRAAGWSLRDQQISRIYEMYLRTLTDAGALDFDDLLLKTVELVETNDRAREFYARKFQLRARRRVPGHEPAAVPADPAAAPKSTATCASSATPISRSTAGAARTCATSSTSSTISRTPRIVKLEQNYRSTQVILDAASAVIRQNRNRKDKTLWTDQKGGDQVLYVRSGDEIEEADFITRTIRDAQRGNAKRMVAVLYRTNAQSRAIEDALMREGVAVPHHRRRPVLRAQGNQGRARLPAPHHQPARRRELPARGERAGARHRQERARSARGRRPGRWRRGHRRCSIAGLQPAASPRSLWARPCMAIERRLLPPRALAALKVFRDLIAGLTADAAGRDRLDRRSAWCSIAPATCRICATSTTKTPKARIENLHGARLGRPRVRDRARPTRRSAASSIGSRCCPRPTRPTAPPRRASG